MTKYIRGIAASQGIAIAKAFLIEEKKMDFSRLHNVEVEREIERFIQAVQASSIELRQIYETMKSQLGQNNAQIFEAHHLILEDQEFLNSVSGMIRKEAVSAEFALNQVTAHFISIFEAMENEYMRERVTDIRDVTNRIMAHLLGISADATLSHLNEPVIIIAKDLTPSDTVRLDKKFVKGFATDIGGITSHSSILARSLEIPAVVGLKEITQHVKRGMLIIIDGIEGLVIINPSQEEVKQYEKKRMKYEKEKEELEKLAGAKTMTKDGHPIQLSANIGTIEDMEGVIRNGAEGIGLFRSEFLYMNRNHLPTEKEQFSAYKQVVERMKDKPVIIRTLDIGGDKELPYLYLPKEKNPFLGYRAIRFSLDQRETFKTQLRAVLRASYFGKVKIMYPMISTIEEIRMANHILKQAKEELIEEKVPFDTEIEVGIMIEIPASALAADILIKEVDFFSIGTNDLIQYTMAADRMNEKVSHLYQPYHPVILRLIKMVIDAAHQQGKWAGMCGEMAGDPIAAPILLGLGLDEFSMNSSSILPLRNLIRRLSIDETKKLALESLQLESQDEIKVYIQSYLTRNDFDREK